MWICLGLLLHIWWNNWVMLRPLSPILPSAHPRAELDLLCRWLCTDFVKKTNLGRFVLSQTAEGPRICFALMVHLKEEKSKTVNVCAAAARRAPSSSPCWLVAEPCGTGLVCNACGGSLSPSSHFQPLCWDIAEKS